MTVFDEMEHPAGLQHAAELGERGIDVGNSAQRPRRQHGVERFGRQIEMFTGEPGQLHLGR